MLEKSILTQTDYDTLTRIAQQLSQNPSTRSLAWEMQGTLSGMNISKNTVIKQLLTTEYMKQNYPADIILAYSLDINKFSHPTFHGHTINDAPHDINANTLKRKMRCPEFHNTELAGIAYACIDTTAPEFAGLTYAGHPRPGNTIIFQPILRDNANGKIIAINKHWCVGTKCLSIADAMHNGLNRTMIGLLSPNNNYDKFRQFAKMFGHQR